MGARIGRSLVLLSFFTLFGCSSTTVNPGGPEKGGTSDSGSGGSSASGGSAGSTSGSGGAAGSGLAPTNLGQAILWNGDCSTSGAAQSASVAFTNDQPFAVELWYRIESAGAEVETLVDKGGMGSDPGWALSIDRVDSTSYHFTLCTTNDAYARVCKSAQPLLEVGQKYHLAVSHASLTDSYQLYVRGESELKHTMTPLSGLPTTWTVQDGFEVSSCSSAHAFGTMDALMIWNVPRSGTELDDDAYANQDCSASNLAVSFDFEDLTANKIKDCKGSLFELGINGSVYKPIDSPFGSPL